MTSGAWPWASRYDRQTRPCQRPTGPVDRALVTPPSCRCRRYRYVRRLPSPTMSESCVAVRTRWTTRYTNKKGCLVSDRSNGRIGKARVHEQMKHTVYQMDSGSCTLSFSSMAGRYLEQYRTCGGDGAKRTFLVVEDNVGYCSDGGWVASDGRALSVNGYVRFCGSKIPRNSSRNSFDARSSHTTESRSSS
jgi:hypothetical protein